MFQLDDRVRKKYLIGGKKDPYAPEGTVVAINGRFITVKHDLLKDVRVRGVDIVAPRFDYLADEIEFINPLLRLASNL